MSQRCGISQNNVMVIGIPKVQDGVIRCLVSGRAGTFRANCEITGSHKSSEFEVWGVSLGAFVCFVFK